ncbi:MAG: hypothetical protein KAH84_11425 [Thiomargarita sp.]|nr:hypothetical protein [Thiomargarita sp.]
MKTLNYSIIFCFSIFIFFQTAFAGDHHYWDQNFGSRSSLMSGVVVGGVRDTSAGFYNPGALGFVKQHSLSVSANAYQLERLSINNGLGTGDSLDSDQINIIPILASGTLFLKYFPEHTFGYSLLAKTTSSTNISGRVEKITDVLDTVNLAGTKHFEGDEKYIGQVFADSEVTELWGGISWANQINPNISIGATLFTAFRQQTQSENITVRAANNNMMASLDKLDYIDFWNIRLLLKLGLAAEINKWKLGATVTLPSRNLFGQATVAGENSFSNLYDSETNEFTSDLVSNRQENMNITYKTPLSIAIGAEYAITEKTNLAATVEWFKEKKQYDVITPGSYSFLRNIVVDEFLAFQDDDQKELIKVKDGAESVINFGVAVEHSFTKTVKAYLSFSVDHETNPNTGENSLGIMTWDVYHITSGVAFKRKRSELAIGFNYGIGRPQTNFKQVTNFEEIGNNILLGEEHYTDANYNVFSLIIGYTYFFSNK